MGELAALGPEHDETNPARIGAAVSHIDHAIYDLASEFSAAVSSGKYAAAAKTHTQINRRLTAAKIQELKAILA